MKKPLSELFIFLCGFMGVWLKLITVTYVSSPSSDLLIQTLEFNNETAGVIRLAQSFNDVTATTELAEVAAFIESAWDVSLPNKDATGQR